MTKLKEIANLNWLSLLVVRLIGLEPTQLALLDPKSSASTNFATGACVAICGCKVNTKLRIKN